MNGKPKNPGTCAVLVAILVTFHMSAMASDATVLACRATEPARISAGDCGAHGCDCGLLREECGEARRFLVRSIAKVERE